MKMCHICLASEGAIAFYAPPASADPFS